MNNSLTGVEDPQRDLLAQLHAAEYSAFMGRVSSWENLQYAAWPILIGALALLIDMENIPVNYRWWMAVLVTLGVYVAYQGTMVNMLYYVLFIERDLRPLAGQLIGHENFWIHERLRHEDFPWNPAWSPIWPALISCSVIALVAGGLAYKYGIYWGDIGCLVVELFLAIIVGKLTRNGNRLKEDIKRACTPEVGRVKRQNPEVTQ